MAREEQRPAEVGIDNHREALSIWLDLFRWMAAVAVVMGHVSHRLFIRLAEVPHDARSPVFYLLGGLSAFSAPAVIIFFVLSGFLVGGGSLRRYRRSGRIDFGDYLLARLTRLWVVLLPALLLTFAINMLGASLLPGSQPGASDAIGIAGRQAFVNDNDPATFLCNMAFLQTAACRQYGHNGALWSLFNEFWYYIAWLLVMLALWGRGPMIQRVLLIMLPLAGLSLLAHRQFLGSNIAVYFSIWLLGVLAADRRRPLIPMPPIAAAIVMLVALGIWRAFAPGDVQGTSIRAEFPLDFIVALAFANLIMALKAAPRLHFPPVRRVHRLLAGFSFSLYCSHTPVINMIVAIMVQTLGTGRQMPPAGLLSCALFGGTVLVCLLVGYLLSLVSERHTQRIRRYLRPRLRMQAAA